MWEVVHSVTQESASSKRMFEAGTPVLSKHDCYFAAVDAFHRECYNLGKNDYALRLVYALANLCEEGHDGEAIVRAIGDVCSPVPEIVVQP